MDTDIRDEIDRSFGDGPPTGPDDLLALGQRALLRRRLAEGGAMLAVAVVVVGGLALANGGQGPTTAPQPVAPGTPTSTPTPPSGVPALAGFPPAPGTPRVLDDSLRASWPVEIRADGLHVSTRITVLRYVDDPWQLRSDGEWSAAAAYRDAHGNTYWWAGYADESLGGSSAGVPAENASVRTFSGWVAQQGADLVDSGAPPGRSHRSDPPGHWPGITDLDLVRFAGDTERLEPRDGVTVLQQRAHPDLPASWATARDRSAVAEVSFEGTRYYVLVRMTGSDAVAQQIAVKAARGGATLEDFLDLARQRYAEGGGGLL